MEVTVTIPSSYASDDLNALREGLREVAAKMKQAVRNAGLYDITLPRGYIFGHYEPMSIYGGEDGGGFCARYLSGSTDLTKMVSHDLFAVFLADLKDGFAEELNAFIESRLKVDPNDLQFVGGLIAA